MSSMIDPFRFELVGQRVHIPKGSAVCYWHLQGKKIANKDNQKYFVGRMEVDVGGIRRGEEVGGVWHDCSKNQKSLMTEKKKLKVYSTQNPQSLRESSFITSASQ